MDAEKLNKCAWCGLRFVYESDKGGESDCCPRCWLVRPMISSLTHQLARTSTKKLPVDKLLDYADLRHRIKDELDHWHVGDLVDMTCSADEFLNVIAERIRERRFMFVHRPPTAGEEATLREIRTAIGRLYVAIDERRCKDARKAIVETSAYLGILWEIEGNLQEIDVLLGLLNVPGKEKERETDQLKLPEEQQERKEDK